MGKITWKRYPNQIPDEDISLILYTPNDNNGFNGIIHTNVFYDPKCAKHDHSPWMLNQPIYWIKECDLINIPIGADRYSNKKKAVNPGVKK